MSPKTTCNEWSPSRGFMGGPCNRELKTKEQRSVGLCGIHLGAKKRREAGDRRREAQAAERNKYEKSLEGKCEALAKLGIKASPHVNYLTGKFPAPLTGKVTVDPDELLKLLGDPK